MKAGKGKIREFKDVVMRMWSLIMIAERWLDQLKDQLIGRGPGRMLVSQGVISHETKGDSQISSPGILDRASPYCAELPYSPRADGWMLLTEWPAGVRSEKAIRT